MGDVTKPENKTLPDLSTREWVVLTPLVVLMLVMGVYPHYFIAKSQPALDRVAAHFIGTGSDSWRTPPASAANTAPDEHK